MSGNPFSEVVTDGIRVHAAAQLLPEESEPDEDRHVYGYRITLHNESDQPAQLMSRHWIIVDGDGRRRDVRGAGVIGEQPRLAPGQRFSYTSFSPLPTSWGTMEGSFTFRADDGRTFPVQVGRFLLVPTAPALDLAPSGT